MINLFLNNFSFGPWSKGHNFYWFLKFVILNFGMISILSIFLLFLLILGRIKLTKDYFFLILITTILISTPLLTTFTIDGADMLKFFYMAIFPLSIFSGIVIEKILKKKSGFVLSVIIIFLVIASGFIDLAGSYLNRNFAYSQADLDAGVWVMSNTPQKSVFMTYPSIHSSVTDIAGRLRVLSYTTWPYTHGYNTGADNIFTRQADIEAYYKYGDESILDEYKVNYVFLGSEEISNFPEAKNAIELNTNLLKVYDKENIQIYQRKTN